MLESIDGDDDDDDGVLLSVIFLICMENYSLFSSVTYKLQFYDEMWQWHELESWNESEWINGLMENKSNKVMRKGGWIGYGLTGPVQDHHRQLMSMVCYII